jgi:predicted  nucleic acid-binding Zn-ribbon protein
VTYDKHRQPTAVLYHVLPALILNELQRQHRRLDDQQRTIDAQRREIESLRIRLAAHDREVETLQTRLRATSMALCGRRACS